MKTRMNDFIAQLSHEFGLSQKHVEVIINQPFKFLAQMVRQKENKTFRLQNFGIFFPKKSAKFDVDGETNETIGDIQCLHELDKPNTRAEDVSSGEVGDL